MSKSTFFRNIGDGFVLPKLEFNTTKIGVYCSKLNKIILETAN